MQIVQAATLAATLGAGLMAGVFFAFSSFVMAALARVPAPAGIAAMQAINRTVINVGFLGTFLGTAALCAALAAAAVLGWADVEPRRVAGALCYLLGTFGVTIACNVPRNDRLEQVSGESAQGQAYWQRYLREWTRWNHVRTGGALLAVGLLAA